MARSGLLQGVGVALLLTVGAAVGQRTSNSDQAGVPSPLPVGATSASAPVVAPHLDGAALLSAYYQREVTSVDRGVLRVLILTLPDPVSSHLDWSYDAELESVRRAMEHSGYVIDRFWLPWRATADTAAARLGVADSLPAARWPGVLLFRPGNPRDTSLVLIYVVGEVPTSGIHRLAMREALEERRRILPIDSSGPTADTVRVIGPAFSGSSVSLRRALAGWRASVNDSPAFEIVSGSASDATNLTTLSNAQLKMRFHATVHTSGWLAAAALRIVTRQLHIDTSDVAFLHEGTTQFGNSTRSDSASLRIAAFTGHHNLAPPPATRTGDSAVTRPLDIAFPMSISGLRVEYARHPDRVVTQATPQGGSAPVGPRLALDQREPASLSESPGVLSQLTAPSTELLLGQIERSLLAHHIRAVGILATDVRDELFLADEIRKRLPDVQLFFYGSNVLLLRPDYRTALRGSLVVSSYPLVLENQFWDLTRTDRERLTFTSDESEGVFNATLYQLGRGAGMMEYAPPMADSRSFGPPTWLTVVGRDAMYPVALADTSTAAGRMEWRYIATRAAEPQRRASEANTRPRQFMLVLLLMLAGFITSFVLLQRRTSRRVKAAAAFPTETLGERKADGSENRDERQRALRWASLLLYREMYVLLRQVSLFAAFSCAILVLLRPQAHGVSTEGWVLLLLAAVAGFLTSVVFWRALVQSREVLSIGKQHGVHLLFAGFFARRRDRLLAGVEWVARFLVFALGLAYFVLTLVFLGQVMGLDAVKSALFFQRAVAVTGGVSPAVPLVLAAVGFAAWCTWHLTRIALLAEPTVFEEYLLRQAESEAIRAAAAECVRSMAMEAAFQADEAREWSGQAIRSRRRQRRQNWAGVRAAADAGGTVISPDELLERAVAASAAVHEVLLEAQAEAQRAVDATPSLAWPSSDPVNDATQNVRLSAIRADAYVARAQGVFDAERVKAERKRARRTAAEAGWRSTLQAFFRRLALLRSRMRARIDDAFGRRAGLIVPLRVGMRTTGRSVGALANWYERASHERLTVRRTPSAAREVSDALFYLIPNGAALAVLVVVIGFAVWLWLQFELSLESLILSPLPWFGVTSFDVLFRFAVLALTGVTAWAVYRLTVVWTGIRRILDELPPDLVPSFAALPPKLARVTHLTLFGHASAAEIKEVVDQQARKMADAYALAAKYLTPGIRKDLGPEPCVLTPIPRARPYHLEAHAYKDFERLHDTLDVCRKHHLLEPELRSLPSESTGSRAPANGHGVAAHVASRMAAGGGERGAWARSVADLYVVFVADYVDWVFQHMRYLASFLLICLLVMVVLLSAYPFQPQSALKVIHTIILVVAVATLVLVIVQMNQQPVLSAIANTTPGAVSWDGRFVSTLATYGALPLLTFLSAEFPSVREFLFSWVAPLIRTFAKG